MESEEAKEDLVGENASADEGSDSALPVYEGLNIYQRLHQIRREAHGVDKNGKHGSGFAFVKHDDVTRALSGLYVRWGVDREVTVVQAQRDENILSVLVRVSWVNVDNPSNRKVVEVFAEGVDIIRRGGEANIDGLAAGKALSYAVKMAELKNLCLVGDSTPDSESSYTPPSTAPESRPEPLKGDEFEMLKKEYLAVESQDALRQVRTNVSKVISVLTEQQKAKLYTLDKDAKARANGEKEGKRQ